MSNGGRDAFFGCNLVRMRQTASIRSGRRLGTVAALTGCLLLLVAAPSQATSISNFGTREYSFAKRYGGQVNIRTPAIADESISNAEISLWRIVAQNTRTAGASIGLVQSGLYRSGAGAQLDTCGTSVNQYEMYTEVLKAGTNNYVCTVSGVATPGFDNQAGIFADDTTSNNWQAYVTSGSDSSGPFLDPTNVGFVTAYTAIGGEINGGSAGTLAKLSRTRTCYGCGVNDFDPLYGPGWYVYTNTSFDKGGRQVTSPSTTSLYPSSSGWTVPNVPTPLTITHTP